MQDKLTDHFTEGIRNITETKKSDFAKHLLDNNHIVAPLKILGGFCI